MAIFSRNSLSTKTLDALASVALAIAKDAGVAVSLEDSWVGFDQVNVNQFFEAWYTTKPYRLGMELSISRSIILDHRRAPVGDANASCGASFQFFLPAWKGQKP